MILFVFCSHYYLSLLLLIYSFHPCPDSIPFHSIMHLMLFYCPSCPTLILSRWCFISCLSSNGKKAIYTLYSKRPTTSCKPRSSPWPPLTTAATTRPQKRTFSRPRDGGRQLLEGSIYPFSRFRENPRNLLPMF